MDKNDNLIITLSEDQMKSGRYNYRVKEEDDQKILVPQHLGGSGWADIDNNGLPRAITVEERKPSSPGFMIYEIMPAADKDEDADG